MQQLELLAPAGSFDALRAGVQNGADAVYLGGRDFGARAYASNFDKDTMEKAVQYAHVRGVKVYVTVNTLLKDFEIEDLMEYIKFLYEIDVDAVIVQDLGVFNLIKTMFPDFQIHASTQMTLHNKYGVNLLKEMGVKRAVLARELTVDEIKNIYDETGMELEVFVHGALCVAYSGQCLMSSFIGGRSGNRGRCAQPCRKEYELSNLNTSNKALNKRAFHLSMRDLNTLEDIGQLIEAGVRSFKIEGRMKKPQYVASVVRAYRKAIDTYLASKKSLKDNLIQEEMEQMFNRKFTKGYLFNSPKAEVINIEKPNNRGLYLGEVDQVNKRENKFKIKLEVGIAKGDGIEIWARSSGDTGGIVTGIYIDGRPVEAAERGQVVEIGMRGSIQKGDKVYKTLNASLIGELEKTYVQNQEHRQVNIYGEIEIKIGDNIRLHMWDEEGHSVYAESDVIVEEARRVSITENKVLEQVGKLGNTPFHLKSLAINLEDKSSVPISALNSLRRDGVEKLLDLRKNRNKRELVGDKEFSRKLKQLLLMYRAQVMDKVQGKQPTTAFHLSIKIDTLDHLKAALNHNINRIYYGDIATFKDAIFLCKNKNVEIYLRTPSILRNSEYNRLEDLLEDLSYDGILAGDLGAVEFNKLHWKLPVIGDFSLNIMNSYTAKTLKELGLDGITLSPELDFRNIYKLNLSDKLEKEAIIYGKTLVMTTEYCPLIQENKCNHKCETCNFTKYRYNFALKDTKNISFPLAKDYWGRSIILNSKPIFMLDKLHDFKNTSIDSLRLEFTDEDVGQVEKIVELALENIKHIQEGRKLGDIKDCGIKLKDGFTRGHYYRGVE